MHSEDASKNDDNATEKKTKRTTINEKSLAIPDD